MQTASLFFKDGKQVFHSMLITFHGIPSHDCMYPKIVMKSFFLLRQEEMMTSKMTSLYCRVEKE